ncbi:MAG: hypothetical protein IJJ99_02560 [Oscillospiraceae bacterium]|nr:hypothetical protein [Oscillospiraceae bacterium]
MLVTFFFRRYPNSRLATFVSVIAGISLCFSAALITALIFSGLGKDADEKRAFLLCGIICAALYFVLRVLANWINERKSAKHKTNEKYAKKGESNMYESTQTEQPKNKRFRFWWIIVGIIALLIGKGLGNRIGTEWSNRNASETNERETTVAEEQDDGSLPASLRGSVGETKTFDCYYIEAVYFFNLDNYFQPVIADNNCEYLCKVYIGEGKHDTDCVYMHISVVEYTKYFGQDSTSTVGASGAFLISTDGNYARKYDTPIKITAKIIDIHDTALNGEYSFADDIESKTGKTKMMDFISISN